MRYNWYDNNDNFSDAFLRSAIKETVLKIDSSIQNNTDIWRNVEMTIATVQKQFKYNKKILVDLKDIVLDENEKETLRNIVFFNAVYIADLELALLENQILMQQEEEAKWQYIQNLIDEKDQKAKETLNLMRLAEQIIDAQRQQLLKALLMDRQVHLRNIKSLHDSISDGYAALAIMNKQIIAIRQKSINNALKNIHTANYDGKYIFDGVSQKNIENFTAQFALIEEARARESAIIQHKINQLSVSAPEQNSTSSAILFQHSARQNRISARNELQIQNLQERLDQLNLSCDRKLVEAVKVNGLNIESSHELEAIKAIKSESFGADIMDGVKQIAVVEVQKCEMKENILEQEELLRQEIVALKEVNKGLNNNNLLDLNIDDPLLTNLRNDIDGLSFDTTQDISSMGLDLNGIDLNSPLLSTDDIDLSVISLTSEEMSLPFDSTELNLDEGLSNDLLTMDLDGLTIDDLDISSLGSSEKLSL